MKFIATCLLFLLVSNFESKVIKDFARHKCDCFERLVKTGQTMKRQNDKQTGGALFGGTTVSMNLDSDPVVGVPADHKMVSFKGTGS